ncbi:MAG: hypothetical protein Wins2KO_21980 [Winogradskyella sp.]
MRYILLFFPLVLFSQSSYNFDTKLEYESRYFKEDTISKKRTFLINSTDNSYYALVIKRDSLYSDIVLHDRDSIHAEVILKKEILEQNIDINIDCKFVARFGNPYKFQDKKYEYKQQMDTTINSKIYQSYILKSNLSEKKVKRKKIGYNTYILDSSLESFLPLFEHETAYQEWKLERNFSNGVFVLMKYYDFEGNLKIEQRLLDKSNIDKTINIVGDCKPLTNIKITN